MAQIVARLLPLANALICPAMLVAVVDLNLSARECVISISFLADFTLLARSYSSFIGYVDIKLLTSLIKHV